MVAVKDAPRTATTIKVRSKSEHSISHSRDPYQELMLRLFQDEASAARGRRFLAMVETGKSRDFPSRPLIGRG
jgi:hypothetical protein